MEPRVVTNWDEIESLFLRALEVDPEDRVDWIEKACAGRSELRAELESLLRADSVLEDTASCAPRFPMGPLLMEPSPSEPAPNLSSGTLGEYRLLRRLGKGGAGTVYLAEPLGSGASADRVAIKLFHRSLNRGDLLSRFDSEVRILGMLDHTHIGRLLDTGRTAKGFPYIILEHVDGLRLLDHCEREGLGLEQRLSLFMDLCSAVEHCHRREIVHRDIKPSNVMVTREGMVKLLDFGIARTGSEDRERRPTVETWIDDRLMTPRYASPEQIRGRRATHLSDVYSLGALLYELLTDKCPYEHGLTGHGKSDIRRAVLKVAPLPPSRVGTLLTGVEAGEDLAARAKDLDRVVLKAMAKHPKRRYASAAALRKDVRRFLLGRTVRARGLAPRWRDLQELGRCRLAMISLLADR